jgi:exopolysaccharide production protein ExoZ
VDVFFVISGFIMMHVITDGPAYERIYWKFLSRRLIRIYFWYWPCLLVFFIAQLLTKEGRLSQVDILSSIFLWNQPLQKHILPVAWSLSHELYFYVGTTLLLWVRATWVPRTVGITLGLQLLYALLVPYREGTYQSFLLSPFNIEFLLGCGLYFVKGYLVRYGDEWLVTLLAAFFIYLGMDNNVTDTARRVWTFGLGAAGIVALGLMLEERRRFVAGNAMVAAGEGSYTFYLTHLMAILFLYSSSVQSWVSGGGMRRELGIIALATATMGLCAWINRKVEMPLIRRSYRALGLDGVKSVARKPHGTIPA